MKLILFIIPLVAAFARAIPFNVTYDFMYDDFEADRRTFAPVCVDKFAPTNTTFGSLYLFPNIGGSTRVTTSNPAECGSCWRVSHTTTNNLGDTETNTIILNVINSAQSPQSTDAFVISNEAFDALAPGQAADYISVEAEPIDGASCGSTS